jgi:hypothetical protein
MERDNSRDLRFQIRHLIDDVAQVHGCRELCDNIKAQIERNRCPFTSTLSLPRSGFQDHSEDSVSSALRDYLVGVISNLSEPNLQQKQGDQINSEIKPRPSSENPPNSNAIERKQYSRDQGPKIQSDGRTSEDAFDMVHHRDEGPETVGAQQISTVEDQPCSMSSSRSDSAATVTRSAAENHDPALPAAYKAHSSGICGVYLMNQQKIRMPEEGPRKSSSTMVTKTDTCERFRNRGHLPSNTLPQIPPPSSVPSIRIRSNLRPSCAGRRHHSDTDSAAGQGRSFLATCRAISSRSAADSLQAAAWQLQA